MTHEKGIPIMSKKLLKLNVRLMSVSYTHLTLPTIVGV